MRRLAFSTRAWSEYTDWQGQDKQVVKRINQLIKAILTEPFEGIGKPEPLKHQLAGWWSRRVTDEHRIVYRVVGSATEQTVEIAQLRHHYE